MALFCPEGTHYQVFGQPKNNTLVFIHGVGLDLNLWQHQVVGLQDQYQIITYDMLGHGLSPNADSNISLKNLAQQLYNLLEYKQLKRVHLIGFSLGGLVARVFATQYHHRLQSLIIMNSVFARTSSLRDTILKRVSEVEKYGPSANIDQALTRWFSPLYTQNHGTDLAQLKAKVLANHGPSYGHCYRLFGEGDNVAQDQLSRISCPTLVTTGELDTGSTPAMSHALASRIPLATAVILPNARHMMPVENASEVNALLAQFMSVNSLPLS